ncbi:MAG: phosphogluconate dehydrogenase (NAD(+)-dependent, decarboxylating) [Thermoplasmata archaeon]
MELGMVGLGRMGENMAARLVKGGHRAVGYSRTRSTVDAAVQDGIVPAYTLRGLVAKLHRPRAIWLMVPAGAPTESAIDRLLPRLAKGDLLIDGGNSHYTDSIRHAQKARAAGIHFLDVGTSGGIWGRKEGYSMMIGGSKADVAHLRPLFETLAPAPDAGWGRVGGPGAGHFVKMVHNGIEYGMMEALGEGFAILKAKTDYALDLAQIAEIWRYGSVVRSWLLDLTADALHHPRDLAHIAPFVQDSGEGRWTVQESIDLNVPAPIITLSLEQRIRSRVSDPFADKLLAAMRQEFGGHAIHTE